MIHSVSLLNGKFTGLAKTRHLTLKGESLLADEIAVSRGQFRRAGFNPRYLAPGLSLELLSPKYFEVFCRISGLDSRQVKGACLTADKTWEEDVLMGKMEALPIPRRIALPYEHAKIDLRHELAHDILMGGMFSREERDGFFRLAMSQTRQYLNYAPSTPTAVFLRMIARSCDFPLQLNAIQHMADFDVLDLDHRIYAAEIFAYSAEKMLEGRSARAVVPKEIRNYFHAIKLFSRG